jgi:DNA polymerase III subunit chi
MEINFYHLTRTSVEKTLPRLLEKVLEAKQRAVVLTESTARTHALNETLWTYSTNAFLPHGSAAEGQPMEQPIWLTETLENPNQSNVAVQLGHEVIDNFDTFKKCLYLFDSNHPEVLDKARQNWMTYKSKGYTLRYFQQEADGNWVEHKKSA